MFNAQQRAQFHPYQNAYAPQGHPQANFQGPQAAGPQQVFDAYGARVNPGVYGNVGVDNLYNFPGQLQRPLPVFNDFQRAGRFVPDPRLVRVFNHPGHQYTRNKPLDLSNKEQFKSAAFMFSSYMPAALPRSLPDIFTTAKGGPLTATESYFTMQNVSNSSLSTKEHKHAMQCRIANGPTEEKLNKDFIMNFLAENSGDPHSDRYEALPNWELVTRHFPAIRDSKNFTKRKNVEDVKKFLGGILHSDNFEDVVPFSRTKVIGQILALYNFTDCADVNSRLVEQFGLTLEFLETALTTHIRRVLPQIDTNLLDLPRHFRPLFDLFLMLGRNQRIALRQIEMLTKMFDTSFSDFELMSLVLELKKRFYVKHSNDGSYNPTEKDCKPVNAAKKLASFVKPWDPHHFHFSTSLKEDTQFYSAKISHKQIRLATQAFMLKQGKTVYSIATPSKKKPAPRGQASTEEAESI